MDLIVTQASKFSFIRGYKGHRSPAPIQPEQRIIVFDRNNECQEDFIQVESVTHLNALIRSDQGQPIKIAYKGQTESDFREWMASVLHLDNCLALVSMPTYDVPRPKTYVCGGLLCA